MPDGSSRTDATQNMAEKSFRVGVWFADVASGAVERNQQEFVSDHVSGCFDRDLVSELLSQEPGLEIALVSRPRARRTLLACYGKRCGRLAYHSLPTQEGRYGVRSCLRAWVSTSRHVCYVREALSARFEAARAALVARVNEAARRIAARTGRRRLLVFTAIPACIAILLTWPVYALIRLATALVEALAFPVVALDRILTFLAAEMGPPQELEGPELRAWIRTLGCNIWLVPSNARQFPTGLPSIVIVDRDAKIVGAANPQTQASTIASETTALNANDATLIATVLQSDRASDLSSVGDGMPGKLRAIPSWNSTARQIERTAVAQRWSAVFHEAARIYREQNKCPEDGPIPVVDPGVEVNQPLEALLFLQVFYRGGVWETTKTLLRSLVEINRERHLLRLSFAATEEQDNLHELDDLAGELSIERLRMRKIKRRQAMRLLGKRHAVLGDEPAREFVVAHSLGTFRADAWLALADRFTAPLLPVRPFGVVVYDMIQKYVPTLFPKEFFAQVKKGMAPTARLARAVVSTNEASQADVAEAYDIGADRLTLVPIPCEPHTRFANLQAEPVELPPKPFILNVANTGPHKGAPVLLRAMARLKARMREGAPALVFSGCFTERFAPSYVGPGSDPHWAMVRQLVLDLGLREHEDVIFLGYTDDCRLLDLFQRCTVVVNAAKYDNGTFSLIEGRYFGRPVLSSAYPAAAALYRRFEIPIRYFPVDDDAALADLLEQAVNETPLADEALAHVRQRLADPKYSTRRYAERIYDLLVRLAREGRAECAGLNLPPEIVPGAA
jgi:glycosyltransferase involved in cell wall biosynthesis